VDIGSLGAAAVVNWEVVFDATSTSVTNDASARAAAADGASPAACTDGGTVCTSKDGMDTCTAKPQGMIQITKSCGGPVNSGIPGTQLVTSSGLAAVQVNFHGSISNNGVIELTGVTLTDNPSATITVNWPGAAGTIPPNTSVSFSGHYLPSGVTAGDLGIVMGRYAFSDEIKVTGAKAVLGTDPGADGTCVSPFTSGAQACASASCHMCPGSPTGLCGGD
jgi:hypothetical protein